MRFDRLFTRQTPQTIHHVIEAISHTYSQNIFTVSSPWSAIIASKK